MASKRFWFVDEEGDDIAGMFDYIGTLKGAITYAQKWSNNIRKAISINLDEDMIDWVYPE